MSGLDLFSIFVLIVLLIAAVAVLIFLAMLPGRIARSRNHPQAEAVSIGGWLGVLFGGVLWPIVLIWAYLRPVGLRADVSHDPTLEGLHRRVDELEAKLAAEKGARP